VNDLPAFSDYAMAGRTYRYYRGDPLFGFGYGLSYTHFSYGGITALHSLPAGQALSVTAMVTNDGPLDGEEVVEVYVTPPRTGLSPERLLAGTQRVFLRAGEKRRVEFSVDARTLSLVNKDGGRAVEPGEYRVYVGGSQPLQRTDGAAFSVTGRFSVSQ